MGMYSYLKEISQRLLEEMIKNKEFALSVFEAETGHWEESLEEYLEAKKQGKDFFRGKGATLYDKEITEHFETILQKREILNQNPVYKEGNFKVLFLEKNWDVMQQILYGIDTELDTAILGEHDLVDINLGYGSPAYLTPEKVKFISNQLSTVTVLDVERTMKSNRFLEKDIYAFHPEDFIKEDDFEYYYWLLNEIRNYYFHAANNDNFMLCVLT